MSAIQTLKPEFIDTFPSEMSPGVLYVSIAYRTTGHLCCCGCGEEVIAPLSPARWSLTYDGETASMHPSMGNWALECQSHYVIRRSQVQWRRQFTPEEIADNLAEDRAVAAQYDAAATSAHATSPAVHGREHSSVWSRIRGLLTGHSS